MVKHIWSVLCEESLINQDNNSLTLSKILESIDVKIKPGETGIQKIVLPLKFEIVTMFTTPKQDKETKIEVKVIYLTPEMDEIGKSVSPVIIPSRKTTMRNRLIMSGLPIKGPGKYIFLISFKEESDKEFKKAAEIPLFITMSR